MKTLKKLDALQKLNKDSLITELLQKSLKGGCCSGTMSGDHIPRVE